MKSFQKLPPQFQCAEVKEYYDILCKKQGSFVLKRILDIFASVILLVFLIIPIAIIAILVKTDSKGPVFYRQERVTTYGKKFRILKFRTMEREPTGSEHLSQPTATPELQKQEEFCENIVLMSCRRFSMFFRAVCQ